MKRFLLFFHLLLFLLPIGCHKKEKDNRLVVGMDLSYPPFEMINVQGKPVGISVDLAENLSRYLHRPLIIENIPFIGLIPSLKAGKIDLIISSMTDTPQRRRSIAFSDPYLSLGLAVLASKKSTLRSGDQLDEECRIIAVRQGTLGHLWVKEHLKKAKVIAFAHEFSAVLEVIQGKVDCFIYDQVSVLKNYQMYSSETIALLSPLETNQCAMGMRLSDKLFCEQVNDFLKKFRSEKGFDHLGNKYLKEQKEIFAQQKIPFYF